jgi:opacity protein-like surface antigen
MQKALVALAILVLFVSAAVAQQTPSFQKWDMYAGYSYLNTPTNSMSQHGFNLSFGRNVNRWVALGMDFSKHNGSGPQFATGSELATRLPASVLTALGPGVAQVLPGVRVKLPVDASSATFAAGTQFQVRYNKWFTPFFRPFLGAFHGTANGDPKQIVPVKLPTGVTAQQFAGIMSIPAVQSALPNAVRQSDTCLGYGFGAGVDFNITKPIGIRWASDYIRTSLFDKDQNNFRMAFGLIYRFGGEVQPKHTK